MPETRTSPQNGPGRRVDLGEAKVTFVRLMTGILQLSPLHSRPAPQQNLCHMAQLNVTCVTGALPACLRTRTMLSTEGLYRGS
jgi:hypothetical protein